MNGFVWSRVQRNWIRNLKWTLADPGDGPKGRTPPPYPTSGSGTGESFGCLTFTKSFRKIRMKRNWNTVFRVAPVENFREQRIRSDQVGIWKCQSLSWEENRSIRRKTYRSKGTTKNNPHPRMVSMARFEPGHDWLNATALTTEPPLIPFLVIVGKWSGTFVHPSDNMRNFFFFANHRKVACSRQEKKSIKLRLTDGDLVISFDAQVPFKHDSLLVDKKELKLTKAEKREAKRGKRPILISF